MQPGRLKTSNVILHLLGSAAAGIALSSAMPAQAQDGAATGAGTTEEPEGESPSDLPAPPEDVDLSRKEDNPPSIGPAAEDDLRVSDDPLEMTQRAEFNEAGERQISFAADILSYDSEAEITTAEGNVVMQSGDRSLRADSVSWSQRTGVIVASGNVRFVDENGNQLYTERVELTDEFEAGAMEDLLLALRQGGRLAANRGVRESDGTIELEQAAYSACAVVDPAGCNKDPSWRITADRVIYDPAEAKVQFRGAYLELFGRRILPLPGLSVRTDGGAVAGLLVPDLRISESNGVEVSGSYYLRMADNKDLTLSAYLFSKTAPMVSAQWRQLTDKGAYQITGYATHSRRISGFTGVETSSAEPRGYVFANGRFQFTPHWSLTGSLRLASDKTFLRRYDISRDDRLRSNINLERIGDDSYFSVQGWATQTLRLNQDQDTVPVALPLVDWRYRLDEPIAGGKVDLQINTLAVMRDLGQDTERAFAQGQWSKRSITGLGQVFTLTGLVRGDVYHSDGNEQNPTLLYRGNEGWETRGIALAAADLEWPLVGELLGGQQTFTPRVQFVVTPPIRNLAIPNEDARAIDLEDSNLFALNRFPGYDRIEDGARVTYGFDWKLRRPGLEVSTTLGQSYRLDADRDIFPDGTGLSEKVSDFVGRTEVRYRDFLKLAHRYRLDKDNLAVRRNEFDATIGTSRTYAEIGYLRLNRNIDTIEDLQDREELRSAVRVAFANYWSVFGSGVFNLTDREEDPTLTSDGFQAIRTRLGVAYQDDCLEMGATWRRDYISAGDARRGDTFQFYFSLKNLGFR